MNEQKQKQKKPARKHKQGKKRASCLLTDTQYAIIYISFETTLKGNTIKDRKENLSICSIL
jgi:hypothetical protein